MDALDNELLLVTFFLSLYIIIHVECPFMSVVNSQPY